MAEQVAGGASVDGLFPMNAEWRARYEAERAGAPVAETPGTDAAGGGEVRR